MKECIEILENKILYLDKEIYKLKEEEWKVKFIDEIMGNLENLPNYMLGLASILPLTDYIELENLYASISIYKKKNQSKIVFDLDEINRKITQKELNEVENYLFELDITNGYIQDLEEQEEQYVPKFND